MRRLTTILIVVSLLILPTLSFSQTSSPSWYSLNAPEGSVFTSSSTVTLRYGQLASQCASTNVSMGPCRGASVGTPTPAAWTAAKTFPAPVNIAVKAASFNNVDPIPGVYKTVQIQQTNATQTVAINGKSVTVPAAACTLTSNPASITFRDTTVGYTLSSPATLSATCSLSVTSIKVTGPFTISGVTAPFQMASSKPQAYTATFAPTAAGAATGSVTFTGNGTTAPKLTVSLSGKGVAAAATLVASTSALSFGNIPVNSSSSQVLTITNTGSSSITVSAIAITGTGFSFTAGAAPFALTSKQARLITVTFKPTSTAAFSGKLTVASNASNSSLGVALSGTGVAVVKHSVSLSWVSSSGAAGYNIYRSTTSGSGYSKINSSLITSASFTDSSVVAGTTYCYVATAIAASGVESSYSNQVAITVPKP